MNEGFVELLRHTRVHMIAIDEVHCVAEWGNSFRPDYLKGSLVSSDIPVSNSNLALVGS